MKKFFKIKGQRRRIYIMKEIALYWKAWRYLIYLKKRKRNTLEDILDIQWSTENSRLATYTIEDWDTAHYRIYTLHILPLSGIHEQKINQGLYKPFTHTHISKHKPTHIQDLTLSLSMYTWYLFLFHVVMENS